MQDNYVSLNPENTYREEKAIRSNLYEQRLLDAKGGEAAEIVGVQFGLTASVLTYSHLANKGGFSMLPFSAAKVSGYTKIGGAFFLFYFMGSGYVANKFGDARQYRYLWVNKGGVMKGSKAWDKTD